MPVKQHSVASTRSSVGDKKATPRPEPSLTAIEFIARWGPGGTSDDLNERAGAQPHFMDLCALVGVPAPLDPNNYCFERGLWGLEGGFRVADVWKRDCFAWEYKTPGGDLRKALAQLMQYAMPLDNPPLLVVSDRHRIQIRTHFTGHPSDLFEVSVADLADPKKLALLRNVFLEPDRFKRGQDSRALTAELAGTFAGIADSARHRGVPSLQTAHFLTQCVFCCFAEDIDLLRNCEFKRAVRSRNDPKKLQTTLTELFNKMRTGGEFGLDEIAWFNGGLFSTVDVPLLTPSEIEVLGQAAEASWHSIDPTILGTLFERGLDPAKTGLVGAFFTDPATIEKIISPVVREPLLAEWSIVRQRIAGLLSSRDYLDIRARGVPSKNRELHRRHAALRSQATQAQKKALALFSGFLERLSNFRALDPACGSGNFLYIALKTLKDIELQANIEAEHFGLQRQFPLTGPQNVLGIEVNEYAAELARATIWIGELQWMRANGLAPNEKPVLKPLNQIECRDALLQGGGPADWPRADVVIGNPPFVGDKKMRSELGDELTQVLRSVYKGRVPGGADLVCYWFEKARAQIEAGALTRAGLVATNSIRGGKNRKVLDRVVTTTRIFNAWSDEAWVNDGAAVRVSLIAFGQSAPSSQLNGASVHSINADLSSNAPGAHSLDLTQAQPLIANQDACFIGGMKKGAFDICGDVARQWLRLPNPAGRSNAEVIRPWMNGLDVARRPADAWIVDFGIDMPREEAMLFEAPFAHVESCVKPARDAVRNDLERVRWWLHARPGPDLRAAVSRVPRFIATPRVAKHRLFVWLQEPITVDGQLVVTARSDDATFGILHSRMHELWSLRLGTSLEDRPRYTPTTCFEAFPFPFGMTPADTERQHTTLLDDGARVPADLPAQVRPHAAAIARAAHRLCILRQSWLNPTEWIQRVPDVIPLGLSTSPYPDRVIAKPGFEKALADRTLTNLYNAWPAWLDQAHKVLDEAVAAAYGWSDYSAAISDEEILRRLLTENRQRARVQAGTQRELPLLGGIPGGSRPAKSAGAASVDTRTSANSKARRAA